MVKRFFLLSLMFFIVSITSLPMNPFVSAQVTDCSEGYASTIWTPDGERLLVGSLNGFLVYDIDDFSQPQYAFPNIQLGSPSFSMTDPTRLLLLTDDRLIDLETNTIFHTFSEKDFHRRFSANGELVLAENGVYEVQTGMRLFTTKFRATQRWNSPNFIVSGGMVDDAFTIYVHDLRQRDAPPLTIDTGFRREQWIMDVSADGTRLAVFERRRSPLAGHLYDLQTGERVAILDQGDVFTFRAYFSEDGRYLETISETRQGDYVWRIWDSVTGDLVFDTPNATIIHRFADNTILYRQESQLGRISRLYLWQEGAEPIPLETVQPMLAHSPPIRFSNDYFYASTSEGFAVWSADDLLNGDVPLVFLNLPVQDVEYVSFSSDWSRALVTIYEDALRPSMLPEISVTLYDVTTGTALYTIPSASMRDFQSNPLTEQSEIEMRWQFSGIRFAGDYIHYLFNGEHFIHSAETGDFLFTLPGIEGLNFNSDHSYVVTTEDGIVSWLNLANGTRGTICGVLEE